MTRPALTLERVPALSERSLPLWQRRVLERAYQNRARYLADRADPRRCSRVDFIAGYLAFAAENGLAWVFDPAGASAAR